MYAVIRNPSSGLVLDATQYEVKLQHFTGFPAQLWQLVPSEAGKFFVVNRANGKVLDIQGGAQSGANLITYQKHGGPNQQWYINSDATIVSAAGGNLALDLGRRTPGLTVATYTKHGGANQQLQFQYQ